MTVSNLDYLSYTSGSSPSSTSAEEILKNSKKKNNRIRGINAFGRLFGGGKGSNNAGEHDDECGDLPPSSSPPSGQGKDQESF